MKNFSTLKNQNEGVDSNLFFIIAVVFLNYFRIIFFRDVLGDDNCWFLSIYSSKNLTDFLNTGFFEIRGVLRGTIFYYFFNLHKTTEYFYLIAHILNFSILLSAPVFLYKFLKNLFPDIDNFHALLITLISVIYPVDITLPVLSNIFYRAGLSLTLISFYLTVRAMREKIKWSRYIPALLITIFSQYFLIEGILTFEIARCFVIWLILSDKYSDKKILVKKTALYSLPFFLTILPLVYYKLIFKPYGIYGSTYSSDIFFFLRGEMHLKVITHFLGLNWYILKIKIHSLNTSSWVLSIIGIIYGFYYIKKYPLPVNFEKIKIKKFFLLSLLLIIPPTAMYEFAGRAPSYGMESRHGIVIQTGLAIFWGTVLFLFYNKASLPRRAKNIIFASLIGIGVFFNNFYIDTALADWHKQASFWKAFTQRFPALPENVTIIFARDYFNKDSEKFPIYDEELDIEYNCEFPINVLYAKNKNPYDCIKYTVLPLIKTDEMLKTIKKYAAKKTSFEYDCPHHGKRVIDTNNLFVVGYDGENILVNREILKKYSFYDTLMDRDFPKLPQEVPNYPWRYKLEGFY